MGCKNLTGSVVLDEKDLKILEILSKNARATYTEIAKEVGLSDVAVLKRVKSLEQKGIIRRYTIKVDNKKLGYNAVSITGLDVEPEKLFDVINYLKDKSYVKYLALTSGDHTVMTIIWARDSEELSEIHRALSALEGVKRVCPAIVLELFKDEV
jgi:Lrp/AsnC family transcriptional regulator for asnA, asnC and gidA